MEEVILYDLAGLAKDQHLISMNYGKSKRISPMEFAVVKKILKKIHAKEM